MPIITKLRTRPITTTGSHVLRFVDGVIKFVVDALTIEYGIITAKRNNESIAYCFIKYQPQKPPPETYVDTEFNPLVSACANATVTNMSSPIRNTPWNINRATSWEKLTSI